MCQFRDFELSPLLIPPNMKLIGYAYSSGRIDFKREDNPWAFGRIDSGMKQSQKDRIRLDPAKAPLEIRSAPTNKTEPSWIADIDDVLHSADSIYLQYKAGPEVLRFRRANHDAGKNRTFVTLGNQDEFDLFASENWQRIRYLYAERRIGAYCFDIGTMFSHKSTFTDPTTRIELITRLDLSHESGQPQFTFDSSGSKASVDVIEWRRTVTEGDTGRYAPEDCHMEIVVEGVTRPFTFLHEDRIEFKNHSYTFSGEKMINQFKRVIRKRLKYLAKVAEEQAQEQGEESEDLG